MVLVLALLQMKIRLMYQMGIPQIYVNYQKGWNFRESSASKILRTVPELGLVISVIFTVAKDFPRKVSRFVHLDKNSLMLQYTK